MGTIIAILVIIACLNLLFEFLAENIQIVFPIAIISICIIFAFRKSKRAINQKEIETEENSYNDVAQKIESMTYEQRLEYFAEHTSKGLSVLTGKKLTQNNNIDVDYELRCADRMEGHQFEHWCGNVLRDAGFQNVTVTQGSGDQGVDVIAFDGSQKYAIQCKRFSKSVGNKAVQEAYAGKAVYHCDYGAVMTNSYFTKGAIQAANATGVKLWDRNYIKHFIRQRRWYQFEDMRYWPHNRGTDKINYDYYASLPPVPKYKDDKLNYIVCYPAGYDAENKFNPYDNTAEEVDIFGYLMVEIECSGFFSRDHAEHCRRALERRYYALCTQGISSYGFLYCFNVFVFGKYVLDKFDAESCCWTLETWA